MSTIIKYLTLVFATLLVIISTSLCYASSEEYEVANKDSDLFNELKSKFSLKERFKRALALDDDPHSRDKRFVHFRLRLPHGAGLEVRIL